MINFISNLPADLRSGGFSAMNAAAFVAISKCESVHYVGPISPRVMILQKSWSKLRRLSRQQGSFFFFSKNRLKEIANQVNLKCHAEARLNFFHGFTPWILTHSPPPYLAWSDCTFRDYIDIFHCRQEFLAADLERIERAEAAWLRNATRILFTSEWAAKRAVHDYGLDPQRVGSVGIFGEVEMPHHDAYEGSKEFVFVSTNFVAKGGGVVLAAFRDVRRYHPDARLIIVGDRPASIGTEVGVTFTGFLRKEIPAEYQQFLGILRRARVFVNASKSDVCPLLLVEAGYFGCPVISTRRFAIPEIVDDGRTGLLLDDASPRAMADAMNWMLERSNEYQKMREAAWTKVRTQHSRRQFEERLQSHLRVVGSLSFAH